MFRVNSSIGSGIMCLVCEVVLLLWGINLRPVAFAGMFVWALFIVLEHPTAITLLRRGSSSACYKACSPSDRSASVLKLLGSFSDS